MAVKKKSATKKSPKIKRSASVSKKGGRRWSRVQWVCVGIDSSYYGISMGGIAKLKDGKIRVGAVAKRWTTDDHYFIRLHDAAKSYEIMQDLFAVMKIEPNLDEVYIAQEEPAAISHMQKGASQVIKQQLEISGALLGGLLRWGWKNIWQIQAQQWQKPVAEALGITTHHSKWNPTKKEGKFRAKEWIKKFHPTWDGNWPDIIRSKKGMVPRPDSSTARGTQSDDRYEALAMAHFMRLERKKDEV